MLRHDTRMRGCVPTCMFVHVGTDVCTYKCALTYTQQNYNTDYKNLLNVMQGPMEVYANTNANLSGPCRVMRQLKEL